MVKKVVVNLITVEKKNKEMTIFVLGNQSGEWVGRGVDNFITIFGFY